MQESKFESLNGLTKDLLQDIKDVRTGKMKSEKAKNISRLSSNAIKSIAQVAIAEENINLQKKKLVMRAKELEHKKDDLKFRKENK